MITLGAEQCKPAEQRKLRILCLHGYLQSAEVFRSRIGSMRKALKSRAELFFLDAPYLVEAATGEQVGDTGGRSWWRWRDTEPGTRPSRAAEYSGWEASQQEIQHALAEHAPIDGLLGFSQGATAAALFLAHAAASGSQQRQPLCALLIGGFLPRDEAYAAVIRGAGLALPCLHVTGVEDQLVPRERSEELWECFDPAERQIYLHRGAHMVPTCSRAFKSVLLEFLDAVSADAASSVASEAVDPGAAV